MDTQERRWMTRMNNAMMLGCIAAIVALYLTRGNKPCSCTAIPVAEQSSLILAATYPERSNP